MQLDPKTLLFSLVAVNAIVATSLIVALRCQRSDSRRDGLGLWGLAVATEALVFLLAAARGAIPGALSIVAANGLQASVHAVVLAAIFAFQQRPWPRWQCLLPVLTQILVAALLVHDIRSRFIWCGLVYGVQMLLIAHALRARPDSRDSRSGKVLLAGVGAATLVLAARAAVAAGRQSPLATLSSSTPLHPVQVLTYAMILAASVVGSIAFILMAKERSDREVMALATTDSLTQVLNRHALMGQAAQELRRRAAHPVAFLMIDVDHFKRINDTLGHPAGDEVLRQVARLLASRLRGCDVLGRYGGEEFCIMAPATDRAGARSLAESLREILAATPISTDRGTTHVTVSIGLCVHDPKRAPVRLKEILSEADKALYLAKQSGRNRVCDIGDGQAALSTTVTKSKTHRRVP